MKVTSKSETTHQRGWSGLFVVSVVVCFSLVSSSSHGKSAAEVLSAYKGLTGSQREQKLIEGAKREGTLIEYGITATDNYKRVLEEFNKKYPFITTHYQRGGAVDTYNKIVNEARAKTYLTKVAAFFNGVGPTQIKDGYNLDGTNPSTNSAVMSFEGPAATSAMPSGTQYANFMLQMYTRVAITAKGGTSSAYNYYNGSWGVLTLLLMTGNMTPF